MSKKLTTEDFIERSKKIHDNKYDYTKTKYESCFKKIEVICFIHGSFWQTPTGHLRGGCYKCGKNKQILSKTKSIDVFIKEANKIHNFKYDYSKTVYQKAKIKIKIICPIHGEFEQTPDSHLGGRGCNLCSNKKMSIFQIKNPIGWSFKEWLEKSKNSKNFDSFKVYIIECYNENERFYKIGRTFKKVKCRFSSKKSMPYKYEIIKEITGTAEEIVKLELKLKKLNKKYKYLPNLHFNGNSECFYKVKLKNEEYI
jgi:hypothetical protein